eukprot:5696238-Prymnesium_polylepis.1
MAKKSGPLRIPVFLIPRQYCTVSAVCWVCCLKKQFVLHLFLSAVCCLIHVTADSRQQTALGADSRQQTTDKSGNQGR